MKIAFLAAPILAFAVACGGGGESAPAEPPDRDAIAAARLVLGDLPSGYAASRANSLDDELEVCDIGEAAEAGVDVDVASRFLKDSDDSIVNQGFVIYEQGTAKAAFAEVAKILKACTTWRQGGERFGTTYKVTQISLPKLGDESVAVRVEADNIPVTGSFRGDFVYARYGDVVMVFSNIGKKTAATKQDPKLTETLAKKAMENLKGID